MSVSTSLDLPPTTPSAPAVQIGGGLPQSSSGSDTASSTPVANPLIPANTGSSSSTTTAAGSSSNAAEVASATQEITQFLSNSKMNIQFSLDQSSGEMVVKIQDPTTGKTIRQIPNELVLQIAQELKQNKTIGNLALDVKA